MSNKQEDSSGNDLVVLAKRLLIMRGDQRLSIEKLQDTSYLMAEKVLSFHDTRCDV